MTNKLLHFKSCLLMMLLLMGGVNSVWAEKTYKLTKVTKVESGGLYVFEQKGHVMNNTCVSNALQTTRDYKKSGLTGSETYVWKLTYNSQYKGYKMMNVSLKQSADREGTLASAYLDNSTSSPNVLFNNFGTVWAFSFQGDGTVLIQNTKSSYKFLGYTTATSYAYKAYSKSNLSSYPHAIVVYKLEDENSAVIATPTFSVEPGTYTETQTVEIACETANTTVFYTLDGTEPTNESTQYTGPITVSETTTIKAIAYDAAGKASEVASATYTFPVVCAVAIGATGMATFACDKALDFTGTDAIYAYTATLDGATINFTRVLKVPAGTGLLLRNPLGESAVEAVNVAVIDAEDADDVSDNVFVAALEEIGSLPTEQDGTNYILNKVGGKLGFYKAAGKKVGAGKAYLKVPAGQSPAGMIAIGFEGDVATGVKTLASEEHTADGEVCDLQGRRVLRPSKGLRIVKGKKIVKR